MLPPGALPSSFGGICLWQQIEKRSPVDAKPNMTNNFSVNAFANECLVPYALEHGKPPHAGCSFEEKATSIFTIVSGSKFYPSNLGSLEPNHCKLEPKKPALLDWDGRSSFLEVSGVEFSSSLVNISFSSSQ